MILLRRGGDRVRALSWRAWAPDLAAGVLVLALGLVELRDASPMGYAPSMGYEARYSPLPALLGIAAAVALCRRAPAAALAVGWAVGLFHLVSTTPVLLVEGALAVVAFGTARWGRPTTVVAGGVSVLAAPALTVLLIGVKPFVYRVVDLGASGAWIDAANRLGYSWRVLLGIAVVAVLGLPWLAGLAGRFLEGAVHSRRSMVAAEEEAALAHREMEQAQEIARLRDEQARLARDVHDVVGHSLAVILAQAESAQYVQDNDGAKLKGTMTTIADSARTSLRDVRQVLTAAAERPAPRAGGLDSLVDGVRAAGHEVDSTEFGTAQPLPPDLEVVAYRVLQEMLTNALKHGRRDRPVHVERHWGEYGGDLRIEVSNVADQQAEDSPGDTGQGLAGMRRRLDSVGGRLDVRRRQSPDGTVFTVTAWVPVRAGRAVTQ
jgi:signal transduction histidine kinase